MSESFDPKLYQRSQAVQGPLRKYFFPPGEESKRLPRLRPGAFCPAENPCDFLWMLDRLRELEWQVHINSYPGLYYVSAYTPWHKSIVGRTGNTLPITLCEVVLELVSRKEDSPS